MALPRDVGVPPRFRHRRDFRQPTRRKRKRNMRDPKIIQLENVILFARRVRVCVRLLRTAVIPLHNDLSLFFTAARAVEKECLLRSTSSFQSADTSRNAPNKYVEYWRLLNFLTLPRQRRAQGGIFESFRAPRVPLVSVSV
nr:hypothetical protein [Pandoravirus massiliensis]